VILSAEALSTSLICVLVKEAGLIPWGSMSPASEMIGNAELEAEPTAGYLEGHDVFVYLGGDMNAEFLARRLVESRGAVNSASFIAMNKMLNWRKADASYAAKVANEAGMSPVMEGQMMALIDLEDSGSEKIMEWFDYSSVSDEAKTAFIEMFPALNMIQNHSLFVDLEDFPKTDLRRRVLKGRSVLETLGDRHQKFENTINLRLSQIRLNNEN